MILQIQLIAVLPKADRDDLAKAAPLCAKAAFKAGMKSPLLKTLLAFCLIAGIPQILLSEPSGKESAGAAMPAEGIYSLYIANSLSMEKYEKKRRQVHGKIVTAGRTGDGLPYVLLYGGEGAPFGVRCVFHKEDAAKLSNLITTMHVIVEGELQGMSDDVIFTDCSLLKVF